MYFKLNIITTMLIVISDPLLAADFGIDNANTTQVDTNKYQCNRCIEHPSLNGQVSIGLGLINSDDAYSGNEFGKDRNGLVGAVSGDMRLRSSDGLDTKVNAHNLGLDSSRFHLQVNKTDEFKTNIDYRLQTTYGRKVQSPFFISNNVIDKAANSIFNTSIIKEREKVGAGFEYLYQDYKAFLDYSYEKQSGNKEASFVDAIGVVNFVEPISSSTEEVHAGITYNGNTWSSTLQYNGSFYRDDIDNLSLIYNEDIYAATPDNSAHIISLSGQSVFLNTALNGTISAGRMIQDSRLIPMAGNPLVNWDGQVDTRDVRIGFSSLLNARWRVNGKFSFSDRDNQSSVDNFAQLEWDNISGAFKMNVPLDISRTGGSLQTSYRFSSQYRLSSGYDFKETERNYLEREINRENKFWSKITIHAIDKLKFSIKGIYENRGGSLYDSSRITAPQENPLLRKYYLADRERSGVELNINHNPLYWLNIGINGSYSRDKYQNTDLGLSEAEDYRYDITLGINPSNKLHLYALASQQWINSDMSGSSFDNYSNWLGHVEDTFINLGAGVSWIWSDDLTVGADYLFANSESNTAIDDSDYGDYYDYRHSIELYGSYALNADVGLKLSYRYERYYDADDGLVGIDEITRLTTLGEQNHNYNAHLLMMSINCMF
ncbi:MtrB/PioB family decaheme-associated outer membrane protein [Shewanella psychromarinicola]|uniref:MtrB/PioB family decaheme-associated outer membrane protein n=2 Tax=Shewanella TaxID=22 RepID=A0A3N4DZ49_9GAMM|nr:MtrB/PioB family decaheme-associated outer membrane protein [Shewanella psychromarinicola]AZG35465.1 MtrB/PioB family decaheme-associated outer membrane protein [Shewanella psychromarinicola]MCL1084122.1 MtrB/PioB family decaheme-associated outer membrane protein [Shewanella psychromarinicola]RPA31199.1 MtrB/PioB family decaheme-associated outer membrane protein [Shewanella psychromarinicola]